MSAAEFYRWRMFEEAHGPILLHDRVDLGLAQVSYVVAKMLGSKDVEMRHVLPPWLRELAAEASVRAGFERLASLAGVPMGE